MIIHLVSELKLGKFVNVSENGHTLFEGFVNEEGETMVQILTENGPEYLHQSSLDENKVTVTVGD